MRYLPPSGRPLAENASDCRTHPSSTLTPFDLAASDDDRFSVQDTFIALFNRGQLLGSNCRELGSVERRLYFQRVVMSQVARCELVLEPYPEQGADARAGRVGSPVPARGLDLAPEATRRPAGRTVRQSRLRASRGLGGEPICSVRLEGIGAGTPELRVNNERVSVAPDGDGWVAEVPADIVGADG